MINFIHIPKNGGKTILEIVKKHRLKSLMYFAHWAMPFVEDGINLYVLRDPVERFCSAVNFALQKWSCDKNVRNCIKHGINTPEKFIQCYINKNHKYHNIVKAEIENKEGKHKIGRMILKYKYIYTPQVLWIRKKNNIYILFENYNEELKEVLDRIDINIEIPRINASKKRNNKLSKKSIEFLQRFYKDDYAFIGMIKKMSRKERLIYIYNV